MAQNNFEWWTKRFEQTKKFFDVVRLDHFRGFEAFYEVDAKTLNAKAGKWQKSFGKALFDGLNKNKVPQFIAEDLGIITKPVVELMKQIEVPGMRVFQFAFDGNEKNAYLPHNYISNCVCYLGTHDNNTFVGFLKEVPNFVLQKIKDYLRLPLESTYEQITNECTKLLACSKADLCILSMQDLLCLDEKSRMNIPGVPNGNWKFRLNKKAITKALEKQLKELVVLSGRG